LESSDRLLTQGSSPLPAQRVPESASLLFENLQFYRQGSNIPVIARFDAMIPAASLVVILGPSGAGKSTMASLILGELTPTSGRICLGGSVLPSPGAHPNLLQAFDASPIFKPGPLFAHFGVGGADSHEFDQAVEILGLQEVIASLPGGARFEVPRSGELPLSKSAAQRVALLRLRTRPAQIAILDEATSELQGTEEAAFLKRIRRACPHTTILAITHNHSLRTFSDVAITFEGDGVVSVARENGLEQAASP
jgi:ABC-type multidrug transport system fused ATPase/permease subunit